MPPGSAGYSTAKAPVIGAVERGGRLRMKAINRTEMTSAAMQRHIREMVNVRDVLMLFTDEAPGYARTRKMGVPHRTINHGERYVEYAPRGSRYGKMDTHTNTIESVWAIVKRAIYGQFHHVSTAYLPLPYLSEIRFRYNARKTDGAFDRLLKLAVAG